MYLQRTFLIRFWEGVDVIVGMQFFFTWLSLTFCPIFVDFNRENNGTGNRNGTLCPGITIPGSNPLLATLQ